MAPLPDNNTKTYFLDYEGPMGAHTIQMRTTDATADNNAVTVLSQLATFLAEQMYSTVTFTGVRVRQRNQNFSLPVSGWESITGELPGTLAQENYPKFVSFIGRSNGGRRVSIQVYGTNLLVTTDYRLSVVEVPWVSTILSFLEPLTGSFLGIDGGQVTWKGYANMGYNAYFQRKRRRVA